MNNSQSIQSWPPESPDGEGPEDDDRLRHLEILKTSISGYNRRGDHTITVFLRSPRLDNTKEDPITCTLAYKYKSDRRVDLFELSPQLGCPVGCDFCACGSLKRRGNLMPKETVEQIQILKKEAIANGIQLSPYSQINFSDGGELVLNPSCPEILERVSKELTCPMKISTTLPDSPVSRKNLEHILNLMKSRQQSPINLQISLYSTNSGIRQNASKHPLFPFTDVRELGERAHDIHPRKRQPTLTFTLKKDSHCVPEEIYGILPPEIFAVRLHPYKPNNVQGIEPMSDKDCSRLYWQFKELGYFTIFDQYDDFEKQQLIHGGTNSIRTRILSTTSPPPEN